MVGAIRNITDPVACARKYLHADLVLSVEGVIGWKEISGMNERRFISIPSQAISQLGADKDVRVPRIKVDEKRRDEMGIIKEEKILYWGLKSHALICHLYGKVRGRIFLQVCRERAMCFLHHRHEVEEREVSWEGLQPTA